MAAAALSATCAWLSEAAPVSKFRVPFLRALRWNPPGRQMFQEALLDGTMVGFFRLMEQFKWVALPLAVLRDRPASCS
jgi:hypothetical protein